MCGAVTLLATREEISKIEFRFLINDIAYNDPNPWDCRNMYYWKPGHLKPRLKFIKKMIRQHRKNEGNERFLKIKR